MSADMGVVGLAVMGQNLALNIESRGYTVAVYNRTAERTRALIEGPGKGKRLIAADTVEEIVKSLSRPRKILVMVQAGKPVDEVIAQITPLLSRGDIIMDGGNSFFQDSIRRAREAEAKGILFLGAGVSGGEEGALHGPSIMPGGHPAAYESAGEILRDISAKVDGEPCCTYIGPGRGRPLREDGPQRDRVRGHAAHLGGLLHHEEPPRHEPRRDERGVLPAGTRGTSIPSSSRSPRTYWGKRTPTPGKPMVEHDPRQGGSEGNGKMDHPVRPRSRRGCADNRRGGVRPVHLRHERGKDECLPDPPRPRGRLQRQTGTSWWRRFTMRCMRRRSARMRRASVS